MSKNRATSKAKSIISNLVSTFKIVKTKTAIIVSSDLLAKAISGLAITVY